MSQFALEEQISNARQTISTDGYPMSIGELTNLYRDGELIIRPEFQRFYRWSRIQKSRLIESLLLGIPIPSIFVSQTDKGIWEVVDGLQRLSTILEFQGELRGGDPARQLPKLQLQGTKYLPALEGKYWLTDDLDSSLTDAQRIDIKRSKIDLKIIKRDASSQTKFDLFQRLNSYGSQLNDQEMRSAMLVAASPDFFSELERLGRHDSFRSCVQLSEKLIEERYDLELVTRFAVLHDWPSDQISQSSLRDLPRVLDDAAIKLANRYPVGGAPYADTFIETFDWLLRYGGEDILRRWDPDKDRYTGAFSISAFEIFALGVGYNMAKSRAVVRNLAEASRRLWSLSSMAPGYSTGRSTESRLVEFLPLGRGITWAD